MTICDYCNWNDITIDELGAIGYCTEKDIYDDKMEKIVVCYSFKPKPKEDYRNEVRE